MSSLSDIAQLDLLRRIAHEDRIAWEGRFRPPLNGAAIVPRLARALPVRLAVGGSPDGARRAGTPGVADDAGVSGRQYHQGPTDRRSALTGGELLGANRFSHARVQHKSTCQ
ncbi:hypothetical protein J8N05_41775 [Streptomyces sp. BH-SS-21]|uniref:Uncharacterized protein n=1 Tax=Streptomyces liliiviolaceus TaxID=2823109 RepID=A0A940Y357_9ACTN|nr:hypothetical protein [Streptomyces liliiviolaceus]MBQ0854693.1 hypothetical protein [Streptomyces liliiviolaceus]